MLFAPLFFTPLHFILPLFILPLFILLLFSFHSERLQAQEKEEKDKRGEQKEGEEDIYRARIIISGSHRKILRESIVATEVIDRQEIEEQGATNAAQALQYHPGIIVGVGLRGRQIRLRGLDPKHVLILINGERLIGGLDGAADLTRIKAEEIERIEIIKGASSVLYGSSAIGGVINIITRNVTRPIEASIEASFGTGEKRYFGSDNETGASAFVGSATKTFNNSLTIGWHRGGGYDLDPVVTTEDLPEKAGTNGSKFRDFNIGHRTQFFLLDNLHLNTQLYYRYFDQDLVDFSPPLRLSDRNNETHDLTASVSPILYLKNDNRLLFTYTVSRYHDKLTEDQRGSDELDKFEVQENRLSEGRLQLDYGFFKNHLFSIGTESLLEELISPRIDDGYGFRQRSAFFIQDEWTLATGALKWALVPGVRWENDSQFGTETIPKFSARFEPHKNLRLRASVGAGYRAPSLKDLYLEFRNIGVGYQVIGNDSLEPERSTSYSLDTEYEPVSWLWFSLNFYYNLVSNLIDNRRLQERRDELTTFEKVNIESVITRGVEFLSELGPLSGFSLTLGYTYSEAWNREMDIPLEGRSLHRALYRIRYDYNPLQFGISLQGSFVGPQVFYLQPEGNLILGEDGQLLFSSDETAQQQYDWRYPYHIMSLRLYKKFDRHYEIYCGIDNLLNEFDLQLNPIRPRFYYFGFKNYFSG